MAIIIWQYVALWLSNQENRHTSTKTAVDYIICLKTSDSISDNSNRINKYKSIILNNEIELRDRMQLNYNMALLSLCGTTILLIAIILLRHYGQPLQKINI